MGRKRTTSSRKKGPLYRVLAAAIVAATLMPLITFLLGRDYLRPPDSAHREVLQTFQSAMRNDSGFSVRVWTSKDSYAIGEPVRIYFSASKKCHVKVLDLGTSGNLRVLYPNWLSRKTEIDPNRVYSIPEVDADYDIIVQGPPGKEYIKIIGTLAPFAGDGQPVPDGTPFIELSGNTGQALSFTRDLEFRLRDRKPDTRAENLHTITIR